MQWNDFDNWTIEISFLLLIFNFMLSVMWEMLKQRSYIVICNVKRYFNCETLENMNYDVMTVSSYFTCGISHLFNWEILVFHHKTVNICSLILFFDFYYIYGLTVYASGIFLVKIYIYVWINKNETSMEKMR